MRQASAAWLLVICAAFARPVSAQVFFDVEPLPGMPEDFAAGTGSDYLLDPGPPTPVLGAAPSRFELGLPIVGLKLRIPQGLGTITPDGVTQSLFPEMLISPDGRMLRLYGAHLMPETFFSIVHSTEFEIETLEANLLPGDANNDGRVSGADYTIWADHFDAGLGPGDKEFQDGDFTGDCHVTGADYTIWADHFGEELFRLDRPNTAIVPEPAAWAWALAAAPAAWAVAARRRRASRAG